MRLPEPNPAVVFRPVSEGAILLHAEEELYFGLNRVGADIWRLLPPACADLDQLCTRLGEAYPGVDAGVLRQDTTELLRELRDSHLVVGTE